MNITHKSIEGDLFLLKCCMSYFLSGSNPYQFSINPSPATSAQLSYHDMVYSISNIVAHFDSKRDTKIAAKKKPLRNEVRFEHFPHPKVRVVSDIVEAKLLLDYSVSTGQSFILISAWTGAKSNEVLLLARNTFNFRSDGMSHIRMWHWICAAPDAASCPQFNGKGLATLGSGVRSAFQVPKRPVAGLSPTRRFNSTLLCFTRGDLNTSRRLHEQCISLLGIDQCQRCVPIATSQPDLSDTSLAAAVRATRFVVLLPSEEESKQRPCGTFLDTVWAAWVSESMLLGAVPILNAQCRGKASEDLHLHLLPLLYADFAKDYFAEAQLLETHAAMVAGRDAFSTAALYFPFWLQRIVPFPSLQKHLTRGRSRHEVFLHDHFPLILHTLAAASPSELQPSASCSGREAPLRREREREKEKERDREREKETIDVDIVLPRCCESMEGDLLWIKGLLTQSRWAEDGLRMRIFVYYKCPWCLPAPRLNQWTEDCLQTEDAADCAARDRLIRQHGGVFLLDELPYPVSAALQLIESAAFDLNGPNGKEASVAASLFLHRFTLA